MDYYNRYTQFLLNGEQTVVPYVSLPLKSTDINYIYRAGVSRLDKISQEYYSSPYFDWLILAANPQFGGLEWNIPDNSVIRVPYPLTTSLQDYNNAVQTRFYYYGR
jgi:hypothetical protein